MDQEYFRRFARRCRDLMLRTASERAREQLCLWAAEFEARAAAWESGGDGSSEVGRPTTPIKPDSRCREARQ